MVVIGRKTDERNGIESIVDIDGILWLNEKHIKEGLDHKTLRETTMKYHSDHIKHWYELVTKPKKQCNVIFTDKKIAVRVIMVCRTIFANKFRTRLVFKRHDVILIK